MEPETKTEAPAVPGPESRRIFAEEQRYIAPGLQRIALMSELTLTSGKGATVEDADGNRYVDFFAGVAGWGLGPPPPRVGGRLGGRIPKNSGGRSTKGRPAAVFQLPAGGASR